MQSGRFLARTRFSMKSFFSFCVAGLLLVMGGSGLVLFASPRCRDAFDAGWTVFGFDKDTWLALHINAGSLFIVMAAIHLILNWKLFWSYIRIRSEQGLNRKAELGLATFVLAFLVGGTVADWPPFDKALGWRLAIKNHWSNVARARYEQTAPEKPGCRSEPNGTGRYEKPSGRRGRDRRRTGRHDGQLDSPLRITQ